jgi:hypothetical protein
MNRNDPRVLEACRKNGLAAQSSKERGILLQADPLDHDLPTRRVLDPKKHVPVFHQSLETLDP